MPQNGVTLAAEEINKEEKQLFDKNDKNVIHWLVTHQG